MRLAASVTMGVLLGAVLTGCSALGGGDPSATPSTDRLDAIRPTETAPATLAPLPAPAGFRTVSTDRFSIAVPQEWEEQTVPARPGPRGETTVTTGFRPVGGDTVGWRGLSVVVVDDDPVGVIESSQVLARVKEGLVGASDVTRRSVSWPGATEAVVVEWTEDVRSTPVRYRQLMMTDEPGTTWNVIALTAADQFDGGEADQALRTFALGGVQSG